MYCAELGSLLHGLQIIRRAGFVNITLCCDNDAALLVPSKTIHHKDPNLDLQLALRHLTEGCSIQLQPIQRHVEAHKPPHQWTVWEKGNVQADRLATQALDAIEAGQVAAVPSLDILPAPEHMFLNGTRLTAVTRNHMSDVLLRPFAQEWLTKRFQWDEDIFPAIHWDWLARVQRQNTMGLKCWLYKMTYKQLPTRHRWKVRQEQINKQCLFCEAVDTMFHCLSCPAFEDDQQHYWLKCHNKLMQIDKTGRTALHIHYLQTSDPRAHQSQS